MILLVNFAPINFLGGAEQWMVKIQKLLDHDEPTYIISFSNKFANIYSRIVLNRDFTNRDSKKICVGPKFIYLTPSHFLPFNKKSAEIRQLFLDARLVYIRFELMECLILFILGGKKVFSKSIAGIHSAYIYPVVSSLMDNLHNLFYGSQVCQQLLSSFKIVHVLTNKSRNYFEGKFLLKNVRLIPNSISPPKNPIKHISHSSNILFVGELSRKKGIKILLESIIKSSSDINFSIVGNGELEDQVSQVAAKFSNVKFYGHLNKEKINELYSFHDALILPSIAEGLPYVILEALSYGLVIIDSKEISLSLPDEIEYRVDHQSAEEYVKKIQMLKMKKLKSELPEKIHVQSYFKRYFSDSTVLPQLRANLFNLTK